MSLDLATVLASTGARPLGGYLGAADLERTLREVRIDSRAVEEGDLFVALPGERTDGHVFVSDALARGAAACLISAPVDAGVDRRLFQVPDTLAALQRLATSWRKRHDAEVIGITGSIGKTTTKEIVASVLEHNRSVLKSEANFNTEIGLPLMLLKLRPHHQVAVLEMGMYVPGDIAQLSRIAQPRIGIVTNVAPIHLERAGSIERIARGKSELVQDLPQAGLAILNADDPWTRAMAISSGIAPSVLIGFALDAAYRAVDVVTHGLDGVSFAVIAEGTRHPMQTHVPGSHIIHAFLAAIAVARELGMDWAEIIDAVARARLEERQRILRKEDFLLIDDSYNAAPMSVNAALELLRASPGRKIAVLGDMLELGPAEESAHREVGVHAAAVADWLVARGPRSAWIADEARKSGLSAEHVHHVADNDGALAAVREIVSTQRDGWAILVKGSRGMRMEEIVDGLGDL